MKVSYIVLMIVCFAFLSKVGYSNPYFDNNQNIRLAHQYIYAIRPLSAEKILKSEESKNPNNGYITFYRFYNEIVILAISNSPEKFKERVSTLNQYIEKLEKLPDNCEEYRLLLGEAKVFIGLLNLKYDSKISGFLNCLKGYNLLEENTKKYPFYIPNEKLSGIIHIGVAFMPKVLQWGGKLLGIRGNAKTGLEELADFAKFAKGKPGYEEEAYLFILAASKLMNEEEAAMKLIYEKKDSFKESALLNYISATISIEANDAETTLQLLTYIDNAKIEVIIPDLLYLKGKAKLLRLDSDSNVSLTTFLLENPGTDYVKTTLYDLACYNYLSGNTAEYYNYIGQVKEKGREFHNHDIIAAYEAKKSGLPNIFLFKADLLIKGGYSDRADAELTRIINFNSLKESEKVQLFFLKGECKRLKNFIKSAELNYLNAVELGENSGNYISQKALVQSGLMMEKNGFKPEAKKYYDLCLQFKANSNPYSDLYNNKAKAGLIRLSLSK